MPEGKRDRKRSPGYCQLREARQDHHRSANLPHDLDYLGSVTLRVHGVRNHRTGVSKGKLGGLQAELAADRCSCVVAELVRVEPVFPIPRFQSLPLPFPLQASMPVLDLLLLQSGKLRRWRKRLFAGVFDPPAVRACDKISDATDAGGPILVV